MNAHAYGFGGIDPRQYGMMRDMEKKTLHRQSVRAGLCVIVFVGLQYGLSFLLGFVPELYEAYVSNPVLAEVISMTAYLATTFLPFLVAYKLMDPQEKQEMYCFQKPVSGLSTVLAILSGYFFCTLGNFVTNMVSVAFESEGITSSGGEVRGATSLGMLAIQVITVAVIPALVEEFALRSIIMQPLRRFGDKFAIVMTAVVFALMHSDIFQSPFAFIAGAAIGYFVIATGSIWVGVGIHMANNLFSVILTYLLETRPPLAEKVYNLELSVILVFGVLATVLFFIVGKREKLRTVVTARTTGEKVSAYILTVPMAAAILLLVIQTISFIQYAGVTHGR